MKIPLKDIVFVVFQFLLFIAYVFDIENLQITFPGFLFWIALVLFLLGSMSILLGVLQLNVHLSPFPTPLPGSGLIQNGVFRWVRHPIYSGILMMAFGYGIISDSGYRLGITLCLGILFYFKSVYEEEQLLKKFPAYRDYKEKTSRFFPGL